MNAAPLPENADDDEIESVAEELLGVDFSSTDDLGGPIDLDDDDLFGDDLDAELEEPAEFEPAGVEDEEQAELTADAESGFDDEFGGDLDEVPAAEPGRAATPQAKADTYWDALEGWDWDEGGSRAEHEKASRDDEKTPVTEAPKGDDAQRPLAKKVDAFLEDEEFGAGLLEDASRAPARSGGERRPPPERRPPAPSAPERRPEPERQRRPAEEGERRAGREGERRPDRGGRRRGRPEGRERRDEGRRESRGEREAPPRPAAVEPPAQPEPALGEEASDFGAGLEVGPATQPTGEGTPEREPRRGRRRRGRGRGRGRDEQQPPEAVRIPEEEARQPELEPAFDFEPEETEDEAAVNEAELEVVPAEMEPESRYQDVPTWAEAISYLVNPKAKSAPRPREGGGGSAEGESRGSSRRPASEGERGHRRGGGSRRGGRGRGRRPPSSSGGE
jgi:hypothetical protein